MDDPKPDCIVPQRGWPQLIVNLQTCELQGKEHALLLIPKLECPVPWLTCGVDNCVVFQWTGKAYLSIWDDMLLLERHGMDPIEMDPIELYIQQMAIYVNEFFSLQSE